MTNFAIKTDEAIGLWGAILAFTHSDNVTIEGLDRLIKSAQSLKHDEDSKYITRYLNRKREALNG
jgi:hypothetical protein